MTYKISMRITVDQIEGLIDQLSDEAKIKLARKLQNFTARTRIREILRKIDARKGKRPSTRDILKEIHAYRQEKNAQSRH